MVACVQGAGCRSLHIMCRRLKSGVRRWRLENRHLQIQGDKGHGAYHRGQLARCAMALARAVAASLLCPGHGLTAISTGMRSLLRAAHSNETSALVVNPLDDGNMLAARHTLSMPCTRASS
jgi:hypothetical protein